MSLYQEKKGNSKAGLTTQRFSQMDSPLFLTDSFFLFIASMLIYYQTPNPLSHIYRFQLHNLPVKIGKPVSYHVQFHARQRRRDENICWSIRELRKKKKTPPGPFIAVAFQSTTTKLHFHFPPPYHTHLHPLHHGIPFFMKNYRH